MDANIYIYASVNTVNSMRQDVRGRGKPEKQKWVIRGEKWLIFFFGQNFLKYRIYRIFSSNTGNSGQNLKYRIIQDIQDIQAQSQAWYMNLQTIKMFFMIPILRLKSIRSV